MKSHRIGSITLGSVLVIFGILFLISIFTNVLKYELILKVWPILFIGLGIEILLANIKYKHEFVYDWIAILLMILLVFFGMGMAVLERAIPYFPINFAI